MKTYKTQQSFWIKNFKIKKRTIRYAKMATRLVFYLWFHSNLTSEVSLAEPTSDTFQRWRSRRYFFKPLICCINTCSTMFSSLLTSNIIVLTLLIITIVILTYEMRMYEWNGERFLSSSFTWKDLRFLMCR